ncbi:MAG: hypothetical protein M1820_010459 [Bogoriella megaspora]|nr:MAG: hypothetical protein M1820_010459 [Bogoriella megaspora]
MSQRMERLITKTAPSLYNKYRIPFHLIRTAQLVSSAVVFSVMCYFIWWLIHDHWSTPWTFILLLTVSLFTILSLSATIVLYCCVGLNSRVNLYVNGFLAILWAVGFSLLAWWMRKTLTHVCNTANWHDETGIMVCRVYKSLFTFSLLGFLSTLCALSLDIFVQSHTTRYGNYHMTPIDSKKGASAYSYPLPTSDSTPSAAQNPFVDPSNPFSDSAHPAQPGASHSGHNSPYANRMPSPYGASPSPDPEAGTFSHGAHAEGGELGRREGGGKAGEMLRGPMEYLKGAVGKRKGEEKGEYGVPEEQFKYDMDDDTEYRGAHGDGK